MAVAVGGSHCQVVRHGHRAPFAADRAARHFNAAVVAHDDTAGFSLDDGAALHHEFVVHVNAGVAVTAFDLCVAGHGALRVVADVNARAFAPAGDVAVKDGAAVEIEYGRKIALVRRIIAVHQTNRGAAFGDVVAAVHIIVADLAAVHGKRGAVIDEHAAAPAGFDVVIRLHAVAVALDQAAVHGKRAAHVHAGAAAEISYAVAENTGRHVFGNNAAVHLEHAARFHRDAAAIAGAHRVGVDRAAVQRKGRIRVHADARAVARPADVPAGDRSRVGSAAVNHGQAAQHVDHARISRRQ